MHNSRLYPLAGRPLHNEALLHFSCLPVRQLRRHSLLSRRRGEFVRNVFCGLLGFCPANPLCLGNFCTTFGTHGATLGSRRRSPFKASRLIRLAHTGWMTLLSLRSDLGVLQKCSCLSQLLYLGINRKNNIVGVHESSTFEHSVWIRSM